MVVSLWCHARDASAPCAPSFPFVGDLPPLLKLRVGLPELIQGFIALHLRFDLGHAVAFLNPADELFPLPLDHLQVTTGDPARLRAG